MFTEYLESVGIELNPGLSAREIRNAEEQCGFVFPPDLRELLMSGLPVGDRFPNWRNLSDKRLQEMLDWPFEGICFDIEHNSFWPATWGTQPERLKEAFKVARSHIDQAPKLIPVYSHRYIPDRPHERGNPVFSVYQTDIIVYGTDLGSYLKKEFGSSGLVCSPTPGASMKNIEFWSGLIDYSDGSFDEL